MEKETIKKQIIEILKSGEHGCDTGIRVQTEHPDAVQAVVGERLPNSYDWDDGETTDNEIDGVCTIAVTVEDWFGDVEENIDEAFEKLELYIYRGAEVILVGGTDSYEGDDPGERIIQNAKCLAIFKLN